MTFIALMKHVLAPGWIRFVNGGGEEDGEGTTVPAAGTRLLRAPANAQRGPDRQVPVSDLSKSTGA